MEQYGQLMAYFLVFFVLKITPNENFVQERRKKEGRNADRPDERHFAIPQNMLSNKKVKSAMSSTSLGNLSDSKSEGTMFLQKRHK